MYFKRLFFTNCKEETTYVYEYGSKGLANFNMCLYVNSMLYINMLNLVLLTGTLFLWL